MTATSKDTARVFVIANRRARKLAEGGGLLAMLEAERRAQVRFTTSLEELDHVAAEAVGADADVVLAGGDGSYGPALTALAKAATRAGRALPRIALIPGGTACTVARNWGYPGGNLIALRADEASTYSAALLDVVLSGRARVTRRGVLTVRIDEDAEARVALIVGAGLVSQFFERYEARGATGYPSALVLATRIAASGLAGGSLAREVLSPVPCTIALDGSMTPLTKASLFCASAVQDLGLGLRPNYRAGTDERRFHAVASPRSPRGLFGALPSVLRGRPIRGGLDAMVEEARVTLTDGAGAFVVDGDLVRGREITIAAGPVLRVLTL